MISTNQTCSNTIPVGGVSSHSAAALLMQVRKTAFNELLSSTPVTPTSPKKAVVTIIDPPDVLSKDSVGASDPPRNWHRFRTVSVCSQDLDDTHRISPLLTQEVAPTRYLSNESPMEGEYEEADPDASSDSLMVHDGYARDEPLSDTPTKITGSSHPSSRLVGNVIEGQVRAVLRKKFSWKTYPELENYLVEHRQQYLQFSSQLNYTAEQKRYNNKLTQGLLDLAADCGYLFEGFTFAAVRDRIRCYYKSYVQANKKKKRKKKRN